MHSENVRISSVKKIQNLYNSSNTINPVKVKIIKMDLIIIKQIVATDGIFYYIKKYII